MLKVLYLFGGENASGAEIVIDRLMRCNTNHVEAHLFISPGSYADFLLRNKPYRITVDRYLKKLNRVGASKLNYLFTAGKNYIFLTKRIIQYVIKNKIDVVHANTIVPASYAIPALLFLKFLNRNTRWVWSDHDITYFSKKDNYFASINSKLFDVTIVVSNAVKEKYSDSKYSSNIKVLYNGLDVNYFKPSITNRNNFRSHNTIADDTIVIGIAGLISKRKGQLDLLVVLENIYKKHKKKICLLIAGKKTSEDDAYAESLFRLILSSGHFVKYLGAVDDMLSFYNGCDIIINNSNLSGSEPLGTTIYEAMACEKIVIVSNTGGSDEIVENAIDGFLFKAEDKEDLTLKIEYCLSNIDNLSEMKSNARNKVIEKFNIHQMAHNYNKIIENVTLS